MKIEQSQFLSDKPFKSLRSDFYDQEKLDSKMKGLLLDISVPSWRGCAFTILGSKVKLNVADIFFLILAASSIVSQPVSLEFAFRNQTVNILNNMSAPVLVYLSYSEDSLYLTLGSDCEHEVLASKCSDPDHGEIYLNGIGISRTIESIEFGGFKINRDHLLDPDLRLLLQSRHPTADDAYLAWQVMADDQKLLLYYGRIEEDITQGIYQIVVTKSQKFSNLSPPSIMLYEFGDFGNAGLIYPGLSWVFFVFMFIYLIMMSSYLFKILKLRRKQS